VTLLALYALEDVERIDALLDDGRGVRDAYRMNAAMWSGREALPQLQATYRASLARDPHAEGAQRAADRAAFWAEVAKTEAAFAARDAGAVQRVRERKGALVS
jgi:hypothetical protein